MTDFTYQLYSSRNFPPLRETLRMVASIGYAYVEGFEELYADPAAVSEVRELLEETGLTMPSGHFDIAQMETDSGTALRTAATLGMDTVICPWLEPEDRPTDAEGYRELGRRLQAIAGKVLPNGPTFAWHNHDFEFTRLADGSMPIDHVFSEAPDVAWEVDVAWIVRAGQDPVLWLDRYRDRLTAVHIKDVAPTGKNLDEDGWADVGQGVVPWRRLMPMLEASPARLFIAEHDNPNDHKRFASRSFEFLKSL